MNRHLMMRLIIVCMMIASTACAPTNADDPDGGTADTTETADTGDTTETADTADTGEPVDVCLALPTCNRGDRKVSECPDGGSCYTTTVCGTTITCLRGAGDAGDTGEANDVCTAAPVCNRGDQRVDTCPDGSSCYTQTRCQHSITCVDRPADAGIDGGG